MNEKVSGREAFESFRGSGENQENCWKFQLGTFKLEANFKKKNVEFFIEKDGWCGEMVCGLEKSQRCHGEKSGEDTTR